MPKRRAATPRGEPTERAQLELSAAHEQSAAPLVPARHELPRLRAAAASCLACALGPPATQTVFGEGPSDAALFLIGEQPGDDEDRQGHPFVGPAGKLLDRALADAGVDRSRVYVTNAVKHFSFVYRGKRRLHAKPHVRYVRACSPWLAAELDAVSAKVIVCLGATAAQALLGSGFALTRHRGEVIENVRGKALIATYHPSAALRAPDPEGRAATYAALVEDLRLALRTAEHGGSAAGAAPPARRSRPRG